MDTILLQISYSLSGIDSAVKQFWQVAKNYNILAFSGEMGAGKTTFIHRLCDYLQVADTVSSPTFALINEYHYSDGGPDKVIYHLDWYRLKDITEAIDAGMEDCLQQARAGNARCFIEWPEKATGLLQPPCLWVAITAKSTSEREMTVKLM